MNENEWTRLMNDQLDGVATPQDSERLARELKSREDLRIEYRKIGGVFSALSGIEMEDPPADLKQDVMREIRRHEAAAPERAGWLESIAAAFKARPRFRVAYAFASGPALGVLGFALLSGNLMSRPGFDPRRFAGTMAPPPGMSAYREISSRDFPIRDGRVQVSTFSGQGGILARVNARAPKGTDLVVSFEPAAFTAEAIRQDPAGNEVMLGSGRLSVRIQQPGESQYLLYLTPTGPAGSPLRIDIHALDGFVRGQVETGGR